MFFVRNKGFIYEFYIRLILNYECIIIMTALVMVIKLIVTSFETMILHCSE